MASSKVMASWSPTNPDPPRQSSPPRSKSRGFGSMNIDDIFRNICSDSGSFALENVGGGVGDRDRDREETAEEVWRDIVSGGGEVEDPTMTLEDFLSKAGAVDKDVRVSAAVTMDPPPIPGFVMGAAAMSPATGIPAVQFDPDRMKPGGFGVDFSNETMAVSGGGGGRGKRKAAVEPQLDKVTLQKQRRMIKNRESAARSRERKQAHTMELEALVSQLEEDNAGLLKEEAETKKARYQQLMKNIIPVTEKPRPAKPLLKKVPSMEW